MQTSPYLCLFVVASVVSIVTTNAFHHHHVSNQHETRLKRTSLTPPAVAATLPHYGRFPSMNTMGLMGMRMRPEDYLDDDHDNFDIEEVRQKLEALVVGVGEAGIGEEGQSNQSNNAPSSPKPKSSIFRNPIHLFFRPGGRNSAPQTEAKATPTEATALGSSLDFLLPNKEPPPPLTSIDRERREAEIQLLGSLHDSDDALSDLWTLWFHDRGPDAAQKLVQAEELSSQPSTWSQAEEILEHLIGEYGVHWPEPVNRLATLYYMQGKLKESEELCKAVLAVKPWHFGALSGIVLVYAGLHDFDQARAFAALRLPTLASTGPNRRRLQWVKAAVQNAQQALLDADRRLQLDFFGQQDEHQQDAVAANNGKKKTRKKKNRSSNTDVWLDIGEDAWQ